jgi:type I restriction enzyme S subunit
LVTPLIATYPVVEKSFGLKSNVWEQRKLNSFSTKVSQRNHKKLYSEALTNSAELGVVEQKYFFDRDVASKVDLSNYFVILNDDFVYNPRISSSAPVGPISRNKLGKPGLMSPLYTIFRCSGVDVSYIEQYFKSSYWHWFMFSNGNTGVRSDRFSIKDQVFFDMPIPVPNFEEQNKIGSFFELIEESIVLHQRE